MKRAAAIALLFGFSIARADSPEEIRFANRWNAFFKAADTYGRAWNRSHALDYAAQVKLSRMWRDIERSGYWAIPQDK